jgi:hypothetical protein
LSSDLPTSSNSDLFAIAKPNIFNNWFAIKMSGACVAIANDHNFKPANWEYAHVDGAKGDNIFQNRNYQFKSLIARK